MLIVIMSFLLFNRLPIFWMEYMVFYVKVKNQTRSLHVRSNLFKSKAELGQIAPAIDAVNL